LKSGARSNQITLIFMQHASDPEMIKTRRVGNFIKQFSGPGENKIVCFKFWQAVVASGCPGECAYCFLQTQYPYRSGLYDIKGTLFENLLDIVPETTRWLRRPQPAALIVGENQDGLAFEGPYKKELGVTPLELLIPLFNQNNPAGHTLIILSKYTSTGFAEVFGPSQNVIFSWSLSLPTISRLYEKKVATLDARLKKAQAMKAAGYRIRFRLDALAPIAGWDRELDEIMTRINDIGPEMLTIGALRASNTVHLRRAAEINQRDSSIFDYIQGRDPSAFKYRTGDEFHTKAFHRIKEVLAPGILLGLCKEDESVWRNTGTEWQGCHCLHGRRDIVAAERLDIHTKRMNLVLIQPRPKLRALLLPE
jgi:DNA repair photolyase